MSCSIIPFGKVSAVALFICLAAPNEAAAREIYGMSMGDKFGE